MSMETQVPDLGGRIAEARTLAGLTQRELAIAIGNAPRTIQSWELNERVPRLPALQRIAAQTGKDLAWFYSVKAAA